MEEIASVGERAERFEDGLRQKSQNASSSFQDDGDKRDHRISTQTEDVAKWASKFNERCLLVEPRRLKASSTSISCSIHRVPGTLHQRDEKAYYPQVISIGPFHHGGDQLQAMEEHKRRYLSDIISRKGDGISKQYFVAVKELEERARNCYSEVIELDSYSFVEMMILDGCFVIEFLRKRWEEDYNDDPIFKLAWLRCAVDIDLLILENQIPFFILQCLFDLTYGSSPFTSLLNCVLHFFDQKPWIMRRRIENSDFEIQHVLHLMHISCLTFAEDKYSGEEVVMIPSASKLAEGGIKFRKMDKIDETTTVLDIKFQNGVIEIPPVTAWDNIDLVFLNLIAFEKCYCHCKKNFTAYAAFMDCLINTDKDVEILSRNEIIVNWLATDGDVADLFNKMAREAIAEDFYLSGVCKEINRYYNSSWPKLRATLVHDYFKNPWAIISFLAALLLLLLTIAQTFFSSFPKFAYGGK